MEFQPFELLEHLLERSQDSMCDLAQSNLPPIGPERLASLGEVDLSFSPPDGTSELRQLVASASGVPADRVLVTAGASEANLLVGMALLGPGSEVVVETPCYEPLWKTFAALGGHISFLPRRFEDGFSLDPDRATRLLPRDVDLLVLTNLYNPGGVSVEASALRELAALAEEQGFYVLVDEIFREACIERPPPCASTISPRFIVTSSLSKVYGLGGLRLGWCIASLEVLQRVRAAKSYTSVAPSIVSSAMAVKALRLAHHVRQRNLQLLRTNLKLVSEWVEAQDRIEWVQPECHVCFPRFDGDVDRLADVALRKYGTLIAPGRFFGRHEHFRLCFGMNSEELEAGLEGLGKAISEL